MSQQSKLFGVIPYIDPKKFSNNLVPYSLNEKSDVYSVGVLLWEISSGQLPFGVSCDVNLAIQIVHGHRETIAPDTPTEYSNIYTGKYI